MRLITTIVAAALTTLLVTHSRPAEACACCSDPGQRTESVGPMQAYEKTELDSIRFAAKTRLFMNAAGAAGIQGIVNPEDTYDVALTRTTDQWTFTMKDKNGHTGTLSFRMPATLGAFAVDEQDGPATGDPVLYKEWRLSAPVAMTGIFASGAAGRPTIKVVFQGRGNSCTDASQFHAYSIVVSGPSAGYTFFGRLP